ncbi:MAG: hypothetical protein WD206_05095 [Actinomycetota bacterium]
MSKRRTGVATAALLAVAVMWTVPATADDEPTETEQHCAVMLDRSIDDPQTNPVETESVDLGCFDTLTQAVSVGTNGAVAPVSGHIVKRVSFREAMRQLMTEEDPEKTFLIGIEWTLVNHDGGSRSYYFDRACNSNPIEVNIGATWNDKFESGKGFSGCGNNRKFEHVNQQGDVKICSPNCSSYHALNNNVSSLRWKE